MTLQAQNPLVHLFVGRRKWYQFDFMAKINSISNVPFFIAVTDRVVSEFIPDSPSSTQMIANISGCLVNSHSVFEVPMPRLPTYINILGTTIEKELRPLPKDIKDFMDGAEHGVVVLTMGMTYVPSDIPPHLERRLIKAFSQLKQRVIMKLHQIPSDLPSNIMVRKILPQQAIMAHPKTVLFFTHAGSNGVLEAIHYRVPMVGLPLYMNQEDMINRLIEKGIAEGVRKTSTAEEIHKALMRVIYNDRLRNSTNKLKCNHKHTYLVVPSSCPNQYMCNLT